MPEVDDRTLGDNIERVRERIAAAEKRAGRAGKVTLIAVSKNHPAAAVAAAYAAGLRVFGENRVEEAGAKVTAVNRLLNRQQGTNSIEWHMIGHLQSRKAADVWPWASMVHSVDSIKLAGRLSRSAPPDTVMPILLELNVSGEASKAGLSPVGAPAAVEAIAALPGLRIEGLMTMAPIVAQSELTRPIFRALRMLSDDLTRRYPELAWRHLSMGMSDDFEVAIEEGATLVRIGRALFGER